MSKPATFDILELSHRRLLAIDRAKTGLSREEHLHQLDSMERLELMSILRLNALCRPELQYRRHYAELCQLCCDWLNAKEA